MPLQRERRSNYRFAWSYRSHSLVALVVLVGQDGGQQEERDAHTAGQNASGSMGAGGRRGRSHGVRRGRRRLRHDSRGGGLPRGSRAQGEGAHHHHEHQAGRQAHTPERPALWPPAFGDPVRDEQPEIGRRPRITRGEPQKAFGPPVSPQDRLATSAAGQVGLHGLRFRPSCLAIRVGGDPFSQISALRASGSRPVHDDAITPMRVKSIPAARSGQTKMRN